MLFQGLCLNSCLFTSESPCGSHYILSSLWDKGPYIGILITPMSKLLKTLSLLEVYIQMCGGLQHKSCCAYISHLYFTHCKNILPLCSFVIYYYKCYYYYYKNYILFYDLKVWLYEYIILYIDLAGPWMQGIWSFPQMFLWICFWIRWTLK